MTLAHALALSNEHITAEMVEASEFPHLANKYHVYGVPQTVINEVIRLEGAYPEDMLLPELMQVMDEKALQKLARRGKQ